VITTGIPLPDSLQGPPPPSPTSAPAGFSEDPSWPAWSTNTPAPH